MSQKKVDLYKEEKKNRQKIMKREKIRTRLSIIITVVVLAALVGWFSWAVYNNRKANAEAAAGNQTTTLDLTMMESYQTQLSNYADTLKDKDSATGSDDGSESVVSGSSEAVTSTSGATAATSEG